MTHRRVTTILATALCCALALSGCSTLSDPAEKGSKAPSSTSGKKSAEKPPSTPAPAFDPTLSAVPTQLLTKDVGQLSSGDVKATVLNVRQAPSLAITLSVLRDQLLRTHAWQGSGAYHLASSVVASSSSVAGVQLVATENGQTLGSAVVFHDPASNRTYPSTALVQPSQWAQFEQRVLAKVDGDTSAAKAQLDDVAWPYGKGPSLGFNVSGDLVVTFAAVEGKTLAPVVLAGDENAGLLTLLGQRARAGARFPTAFKAVAQPGKPAAALVGDSASASPAPSSTPGSVTRPSLNIGPDCGKLKCVALTFDDGPAPGTKELMSTLKKQKVPATFFVLGTSADEYPEIVTQEAAAGFEVASHNQVHNAMTSVSDAGLERQITKSLTTLRKLTGAQPLFLRPPYGSRNKRVDAAIAAHQMAIAIWDVDTNDWKYTSNGEAAAQSAVLSTIQKQARSGSVVLMHDIHSTSRAMVPAVIEQLRGQGYTFVTLAELGNSWQYGWGDRFCRAPRFPESCGW